MKKYTQPKIRSIVLNAEQAILQVCQVGGAYFSGAQEQCLAKGTNPPHYKCYVPVRGLSYENATYGDTNSYAGS